MNLVCTKCQNTVNELKDEALVAWYEELYENLFEEVTDDEQLPDVVEDSPTYGQTQKTSSST